MVLTRGAAIALLISTCAGCGSTAGEAPRPCFSLATGGSNDVSFLFGAALARVFNEQAAAGACLVERITDGSSFNVKALDDGEMDFALARADTVYSAYVGGTPLAPRPHRRLRGMAIVYRSVLHVVVTADSPVRSWTELRDRPVGLSIFSSTDRWPVVGYRDLVAAAGDLGPVTIGGIRMRLGELTEALVSKRIAGGIVLTAYPVPLLVELAGRAGMRLLEIEPVAAARIRAQYPFFKPVVIPAGVYPGQREPVRTIAVDNLLVTHAGVNDVVVHAATRTLLENLVALSRGHGAALQVNPDQASATPIPLHAGAARYYRERELLR